MHGSIRWVAVVSLTTGCPGDVPVDPDKTSDATLPGPGTAGLVVQWSSDPPAWPTDLGNGIQLERAVFAFDSMRVVGDAGDDPRTTKTAFEVRFDESTQPEPIEFGDAPSGLYSQVSLVADGHLTTESVKLRGQVTVDSDTRDFIVDIDEPLAVNVPMNEMLMPPNVTTIALRIDFQAALAAVDWSTVPLESGNRELDDNDPQMAAFRNQLIAGFRITNPARTGLQ